MINDTLHIGDIVVENKQSFVVEGTPYSSDEVRQSFLVLNFAEHTETGDNLVVYQDVHTGKIRCGLTETFTAKTDLVVANNFSFSQACITLGEKHRFYPGDIVRHFKWDSFSPEDRNAGKGLYEILYYAEYLEEDVVVYRSLDTKDLFESNLTQKSQNSSNDTTCLKVWVRPATMFESEVDREKYPNARQTHRFELALRRTNCSTIIMK